MKIGVVMPIGPGREENAIRSLRYLWRQSVPIEQVVLLEDGFTDEAHEAFMAALIDVYEPEANPSDVGCEIYRLPRHEPGLEQPRNVGVRMLHADVTHAWFVDSDVIVHIGCHAELLEAYAEGPEDRVMVCPYDWMQAGAVEPNWQLHNDVRWESFDLYPPSEIRRKDLAAGLACFSGNLVWPVAEFKRVGGFWSELHHGRCEDGELGVRAVAMDVGISFADGARGWHVWHPVDAELAVDRNNRDVPMLNARHPWIQQQTVVFMVDRDGKAFDVRCPCGAQVPTAGWWEHVAECGAPMDIPAP